MSELKANISAEYADTERWRQVILISSSGVRSWMFDRKNPAAPPRAAADVSFGADSGDLLRRIEDAVYDNPLLLEDFPTEIVVCAERFALVPQEAASADPDAPKDAFANIYGDDYEAMTQNVEGVVIAFNLANGLGSFIDRTFPGAKVYHYMAPLFKHFANTPAGGKRMYADIREGRVDLFGFSGRKLLMAAGCAWEDPMDAAYYIFATRSAWNFNPDSDPLCVSGLRSAREVLMPLLRQHINYVTLTLLPRIAAREELPLSVLLLPSMKHLPKKV